MGAEIACEALFPRNEDEFKSILVPTEWKAMVPLTKDTKSYKYVHYGTLIAMILLVSLLAVILATNWLGPDFLTMAYFFFLFMNAIKHKGNLYILPNGIILYGKYYSSRHVKSFEVEQIVRWHFLYGLDSQVNNAFKLIFKVKGFFIEPNYIVVKDRNNLEKIINLLNHQGIQGSIKIDQTKAQVNDLKSQHK